MTVPRGITGEAYGILPSDRDRTVVADVQRRLGRTLEGRVLLSRLEHVQRRLGPKPGPRKPR
jgi:hypothetical protein